MEIFIYLSAIYIVLSIPISNIIHSEADTHMFKVVVPIIMILITLVLCVVLLYFLTTGQLSKDFLIDLFANLVFLLGIALMFMVEFEH